jgi:hypothetical protein
MDYTNDINYLSSLEMLVNGYDSAYPFLEKNVKEINQMYEVRIDTENLFSGDKLQSFNIESDEIEKVILTIDSTVVYSSNFHHTSKININPFSSGIRVFSCRKSEIILYIYCGRKPRVESMYSLMDPKQKENYTEHVGELSYKNGYAYLALPFVGR